jgi:hypothetical protein
VLGPRVLKKLLLAEVEFRLMNLESFVADRVSTGVGFGLSIARVGNLLDCL